MPQFLFFVCIVLGIVLLLKIITAPIRLIFKLLLNALCGFCIILLLNLLAAWTGVVIALSWVSTAIVAILGLPGVAALLFLRLLL